MASKRDTFSKRIAPGIWQDAEGNFHHSTRELLAMVGLEDTPENRDALKRLITQVLKQHNPNVTIIEREQHD